MAENLAINTFKTKQENRFAELGPMREKKEQELQRKTETGEADIRGMQQMLGEAVGGIQGQYAGGVKEAQDVAAQSAREVAFAPTKENSAELTQLFGMLTTVAMMIGGKGRQSGMGAIAAMTGAMEGYQKGRKDVFNNELKEFDKRIKEVQLHNQNVRTKLNDALKTLQTDRDVGLAKLKGLEMDIQGSQAALYARRGDITNMIKSITTEQNAVTQTLGRIYESERKAKESQDKNKAIVEAARLRAQAADPLNRMLAQIGTGGAQSYILQRTGKSVRTPKEAESIIFNSQAIDEIKRLLEKMKDKDIQTGVLSSLAPRIQKIRSAFDSLTGKPFSEDKAIEIVEQNLTGNDKTTLFIKDAILAAFKIEQGLVGSRVPVFTQRVVGPVLDPRAYTKDAFAALLKRREDELYKSAQYRGFDKKSVDALVDPTSPAVGERVESQPSQATQQPATTTNKQMPPEAKLKAYADAHYQGDVAKAREYLQSQGYQ
jgi:hypothetical protein